MPDWPISPISPNSRRCFIAFDRRPKREREPRTNRRIRVPEVRLIGPEGEQLGLFITREAIKRAEETGLDLVEISPQGNPPVCKIMDYGKHKYEQAKRKSEAKKKQQVVLLKEIKMRPSTDEHDYQTKMKHIRRFLEEGNRVKITIRFRGREMAHKELGRDRMTRVAEELKEIAEVFQHPKMEGRMMNMLIQPLKKK